MRGGSGGLGVDFRGGSGGLGWAGAVKKSPDCDEPEEGRGARSPFCLLSMADVSSARGGGGAGRNDGGSSKNELTSS